MGIHIIDVVHQLVVLGCNSISLLQLPHIRDMDRGGMVLMDHMHYPMGVGKAGKDIDEVQILGVKFDYSPCRWDLLIRLHSMGHGKDLSGVFIVGFEEMAVLCCGLWSCGLCLWCWI